MVNFVAIVIELSRLLVCFLRLVIYNSVGCSCCCFVSVFLFADAFVVCYLEFVVWILFAWLRVVWVVVAS